MWKFYASYFSCGRNLLAANVYISADAFNASYIALASQFCYSFLTIQMFASNFSLDIK